ncbi:dual specificity protein phosphatase family protein [Candidatus Woesebacteria bacterium]|nr:dual specificity protein phosphatase family protein [Candidatus Woesebacteria bacterium]QQG47593.1 MAG: dual specificity protein phosphatase family protein [Candidatus Woesebacteria bacterium]
MDDHVFDYSRITENIYIGSDLCKGNVCPIHGEEFEELKILVEINLSVEKKEIPPDGIDIYSWIPTPDEYPSTSDQFDIGTAIINEAVRLNKNVYVHCKLGHGRSPTMVCAYFIRYKGYSLSKALEFVKEKRPEIHIHERQIQALEEYEKKWLK